MDLLEQYKQQYPEKFRGQKSAPMTDEYGRGYTGMVAFVIRLSGGRIKDARTAIRALLVVAIITALASLLLFFNPAELFRPSAGKIFYPPTAP